MNMKKKVIAIALIIVMVMCNCMSVCADTIWNGGDEYSGDGNKNNVTAKFMKDSDTTYNVTITWDALKFTYPNSIKWNGETYDADDSEELVIWSGENHIQIKNNSDVSVNAMLSFEENSDYLDAEASEIMGFFSGESYMNTWENKYTFSFGSNAKANSGITEDNISVYLVGVPKGIKPTYNNTTLDLTNTGIPIGTVTIRIYEPQ